MNIAININTDNDAFFENNNAEIARILHDAAERIEDEGAQVGEAFALRDINGNKVGFAAFTKSD